MPAKASPEVKAELESVLASELAARKFTYPRTDGSPWTLSLKEIIDRVTLLEMALQRERLCRAAVGRSGKSEEAATCKRRASGAQRTKMAEYRAWFHERRRPPGL